MSILPHRSSHACSQSPKTIGSSYIKNIRNKSQPQVKLAFVVNKELFISFIIIFCRVFNVEVKTLGSVTGCLF